MANPRELDKRRRSIRNIRKITRTMELIATARFKKAIGETGRIFSNEVNPERVQQISRTVAREGLKNVTVVTGEGKSANDKGQ